jgi:glycosyltransferase involved in cell wall biosynthesis
MHTTHKVLMLVENLPVPSDPRVWMEATTLQNAGYKVSIICPKGTTTCQESYICIDGIHIYRYRLPEIHYKYLEHIVEYSLALLMTFLLSIKVFLRHGFDVIHAANPPDMFFLIGLCYRGLGKRFVFDQHDLAPEMFQVILGSRLQILKQLLQWMERCSYRFAHLVITTNETFRGFAIKQGHCPGEKVVVVRNGPDVRQLGSIEGKSKRAATLSFPGRRRYLLAYIGVMGKQDGVENVLYALDDLVHKRDRQDVSLMLIGEGSASSWLRELAHQLKLDEYIYFTGWKEKQEALTYLAASDIGLQPDPQNGLNEYCTMIKTMEYMALGLPVVSFDLVETRYSAQDAALYAVPNKPEDFANKIEKLLDDEVMRRTMGAAGRRRIEETLSWEHSQKHLLEAYQTLFSSLRGGEQDKARMRG